MFILRSESFPHSTLWAPEFSSNMRIRMLYIDCKCNSLVVVSTPVTSSRRGEIYHNNSTNPAGSIENSGIENDEEGDPVLE